MPFSILPDPKVQSTGNHVHPSLTCGKEGRGCEKGEEEVERGRRGNGEGGGEGRGGRGDQGRGRRRDRKRRKKEVGVSEYLIMQDDEEREEKKEEKGEKEEGGKGIAYHIPCV